MGKKKEEKNTEAQETKVQTEAEANQEPVEETQDKNAEELKKAQDALAAQKDSYLRLAAEYDNYRKRTQAEKLSIYDDATAKAVEKLLPVADSLDMALMNMGDAPDEFKKGLEMCIRDRRFSEKSEKNSTRKFTMQFPQRKMMSLVKTQFLRFSRKVTK